MAQQHRMIPATTTQREKFLAIRAARLRGSLHDFVRWSFPVLFPGREYVDGEHIKIICSHLEAVADRRIKALIVNVPPRHMKSLLVSVIWPVWLWLRDPTEEVISASYAASLAARDSVRSRRLVESPDFCELFGDLKLRADQNQKMRYENCCGGVRLATSVGGTVTGEGGTVRVLDDPHKADDVNSEVMRQNVIDWLDEVWSSRGSSTRAVEVVVMQRLHERDATGFYLSERTGYEHLCLPALCEDGRRCKTALPFVDSRADGEALWPAMFPVEKLDAVRNNEYVWSGQYRQSPTNKGGNIVKTEWFRFWSTLPRADETHTSTPHGFSFVFSSWDCTFKKTQSGSYVVGQLWAIRGPSRYLIDQVRGRWSFTETLEHIRDATRTWHSLGHKCNAIVVEEAANGAALVDVLRTTIPSVLPFRVQGGDKAQRMRAETPAIESGCVYLPDPTLHPWVRGLLSELQSFPLGASSDQGDAMSQALAFARDHDDECADFTGTEVLLDEDLETEGWAVGNSEDYVDGVTFY